MATAPTSRRLNLTRDQLAQFLTDQQQIRQFELLFSTVDQIQVIVGTDFEYQADNAAATANEALTQINRLAQSLELLALAPTQNDQIAKLQKQIEGLESAPVLQLEGERNTFETISKNLKASGASFTYDMAGNLTSITYVNGIVKTLNYDMAGNLTSIVLSGNIPPEILTVKTLTYDMAGNLTATSYS
jgi:YD repeat-containing protein